MTLAKQSGQNLFFLGPGAASLSGKHSGLSLALGQSRYLAEIQLCSG